VACEAEDKKRTKYTNLAPSFCCVPIAVETTLGALGVGVELLHEHPGIDRRASCNGVSTPKAKCCQCGNAASVLGTVGLESVNSQKLDVVFYL